MLHKNLFKENIAFLITWILITIVLGVLLVIYPKPQLFLMLNEFHSTSLNYLFRVITVLGDGWFIILTVIVVFFLKKRSLSFLILSSYIFSGFIVQLIKNRFPEPRPALYLQLHKIEYANFLDNITLHNFYSFPSGHTTSAFALAASLAFLIKNKRSTPLLAIFALIVGLSRIYLGQHFPEDVIAGMSIGVGSAVLCYAVLGKVFFNWERRINKQFAG